MPQPPSGPEIVGAHEGGRWTSLAVFDAEHAEGRIDTRAAVRNHDVVVNDAGLGIKDPLMPAVVVDPPERPRGLRASRLEAGLVSPHEPGGEVRRRGARRRGPGCRRADDRGTRARGARAGRERDDDSEAWGLHRTHHRAQASRRRLSRDVTGIASRRPARYHPLMTPRLLCLAGIVLLGAGGFLMSIA